MPWKPPSNFRILSRFRRYARHTRNAKNVASVARGAEAHLLGARHGPADLLGEGEGRLAELEVGGALPELRLDRGDDGGMGMAQHERSAAQDVVDVLAAREVDEPRAPGLAHDEGELLRRVVAAEDAARQHAHGALEERVFFWSTTG